MKSSYVISTSLLIGALSLAYVQTNSDPKYTVRKSAPNQSHAYFNRWAQVDANTGEIMLNARADVYGGLAHRASRATKLGLQFSQRGPDNVGGRTRAILELYKKPNLLLVGSISGGLFISYDAGANWEPHIQFQNLDSSSSIISAIHQDTVSGRIYIGTGSSFDNFDVSWPGFGIYYSDDEGVTFSHLTSTTPSNRYSKTASPWIAVNRIRTSSDGQLFAATDQGLRVSSDLGKTWENPIESIGGSNLVPASDVIVTPDDHVFVSFEDGRIFKGHASNLVFELLNLSKDLPTGMDRTCLAASANGMFIYALNVKSNAFHSLYKSTNQGESWVKLVSAHSQFRPMCSSNHCQGKYNAALAVDPNDPFNVFIGGIQLWRFDGNLTRISTEAGTAPYRDVLPNYVHADKHYIYYSPNDNKRLYVTTDGGVSISTNNGNTWQGLNKGYTSTQFYGIAHGNDIGTVIGGSQDNGTLALFSDNANDPNVGISLFGGDGFDCEMSQYADLYFVSSQYGNIARGEKDAPFIMINNDDDVNNPFATVISLWESIHDTRSQDSIVFSMEPIETAIATGNGIIRTFNEEIQLLQTSAIIIPSTIKVRSGSQVLTMSSDIKTLIGNGTGSFELGNDARFKLNVAFDQAPTENANVFVSYEVEYKSNSIILVASENLNTSKKSYLIEHRLESDLKPGDQIKIQDPVQSLLATNTHTGISIYRNVLNSQRVHDRISIPGINGTVSTFAYSSDGATLFAGTAEGKLYRIMNLDQLYSEEDLSQLIIEQISNFGFGGITGIAIDPNNNNRMVVTRGGYNAPDRIQFTSNALSFNIDFENIHGDLPPMPIYDAEFDFNNPSLVLVGTEFGIWACSDIDGGSLTWSDENDQLSYVPVYDIRQQHLGWTDAKNTGTIYVGTHGRGILESTSLVGISEVVPNLYETASLSDLKIYPNPLKDVGKIEFESTIAGNSDFILFDANGQQVMNRSQHVTEGTNTIEFNVSNIRSGFYIIKLTMGDDSKTGRALILR